MKYTAMVQHYGTSAQIMDTFKKEADAKRFVAQQALIVQGYEKRTMNFDGRFVVLGENDIFKTQMWVTKSK